MGLNVRPVKRRVVLFYPMLPSGEFDHYSLHTGCDVGANATKWAANYWCAAAHYAPSPLDLDWGRVEMLLGGLSPTLTAQAVEHAAAVGAAPSNLEGAESRARGELDR